MFIYIIYITRILVNTFQKILSVLRTMFETYVEICEGYNFFLVNTNRSKKWSFEPDKDNFHYKVSD